MINVHLITGFLGSGKTTLLNRLLTQLPEGKKPSILVNELGSVGIDGDIVEKSGYRLKELPSGCVCCTLAGPFAESLVDFVENEHPDVIFVETTGIAQPVELKGILGAAELESKVRLGNVICMVDAHTFLKYEKVLTVMQHQVAQANTVILNKTDLASETKLKDTRQRMRYLTQPGTVIEESVKGDINLNLVYDSRATYFESYQEEHHYHHDFHSASIEMPDVLSFEKLRTYLNGLPEDVYRAKGILKTDQGNKLFQYTLSGGTWEDWEGELKSSKLVFIGKEITRDKLKEDMKGLTGVQ
jgi:G3E family GTPase